MKTEDEARKCWCPFARTGAEANNRPYRFRVEPDDPDRLCVASECMAWRFGAWRDGEGTEAANHEDLNGTVTRVGYCGLAGKP